MKKNQMLDSMEYVDEKLISEADAPISMHRTHTRSIAAWSAAAACLCLTVIGGVAAFRHSDAVKPQKPSIAEESSNVSLAVTTTAPVLQNGTTPDSALQQSPAVSDGTTIVITGDFDPQTPPVTEISPQVTGIAPIITDTPKQTDTVTPPPVSDDNTLNPTQSGAHTSEDAGMVNWHGLLVTFGLEKELQNAKGSDLLTLYISPTVLTDSFVYKGRTIAEYYLDSAHERNLPEQLWQLLKEGDELKYGPALYQGGAPIGYLWDKNFYEERVAFYGEAILNKYIVNGEFLQEKLKQDIEVATAAHAANDAYQEAQKAQYQALANDLHGTLDPGYRIRVTMTKDELAAFSYPNCEKWIFDNRPYNSFASDDEVIASDQQYGITE